MIDEARDRNYALVRMYGAIPSYAVFTADDIQKESDATRMAWWMDIETDDPMILQLVMKHTAPRVVLDIILRTLRDAGFDKACEIVINWRSVLAKSSMFERTIPMDASAA